MTDRDHWKKMLPIIQAFAKGEVIQYNGNNEWIDIDPYKGVGFDALPENYRIKPKLKYRPFNSKDECWQEMLKHEPFGWLQNKQNNSYEFIGRDVSSNVFYKSIFKEYTFADGTPFGIKET